MRKPWIAPSGAPTRGPFFSSRTSGWRGVYRKLRIRGSIDYPLAGVAIALKRGNGHVTDANVAITAVNPAPLLLKPRFWRAGK